ncbi:MAG: heme ABC exporter ATP-binding protein CcmA [Anaerolineae bacterium]|jgi:heme ABC exporter ATP-binding subunit CcmA/heme exporter protein CcmB|nr:heme ABC exporter ATP-binding protein CcmA [Anaerolineae bacterium]
MLEIAGLTKSFGPRQALASVNLLVDDGDFVVLAGPNGAGKTTLLRILAMLMRPSSGTLLLGGVDLLRAGPGVRRQIGYLSHRTLLYDDLTAEQNLRFYARMYGMAEPEARIAELLARVDLAERRGDLVRTYSRGMQQRLAVARTLLHEPRLLLLDEPYTGLDPVASDRLTALLSGLSGEGRTLLLTTHALESVALAGRRGVILSRGRVVYDGVIDDPAGFGARYRALVGSPASASPPSGPRASEYVSARSDGRRKGAESGPLSTTGGDTKRGEAPGYLRQVLAIVAKDLAAEMHTREIFSAMAVYAILAMLIFSFALDLRGAVARAAAPGVLWASIAFAGTLGLNRSMAREQENGGMDGLLLSPADRTVVLVGKALGSLAMMAALEAVLVPLATILFNVGLLNAGVLAVVLVGSVGYALVGTLLAAIAINTRAREVMLPILLLPLVVPMLIAAVQVTGGLLEGLRWADLRGWTQLLVVYDLLIAAASLLTFEIVVEA